MKTKLFAVAAAVGVAAASLVAFGVTNAFGGSSESADQTPPCAVAQPGPPPPQKPTTITTIEQAYYCVFANYFDGPNLDDRALLVSTFAAFTQELQRRGIDQSNATLPALTGRRDADWSAFARVYQQVIDRLPNNPDVRQAVAEATMHGLVESLHQNHVGWVHGVPVILPVVTGMTVSGGNGPGAIDPAAVQPLFVKTIQPDTPAAKAGIKPGDEITSINDVPPFIQGQLIKAVVDWINEPRAGVPVRLTLHRPATGQSFSVTLTPQNPTSGGAPSVDSRVIDGNVGYVALSGFFSGATDKVLAAVTDLRKRADLRGLVLDLRGNGGGSVVERAKLLGALIHDKITSYACDSRGDCAPYYTDDSVPLLHLPLVVLTDRDCASACDSFTSSVKDLHLGTIVGTRTAGVVAGVPQTYLLNDGSGLQLPNKYEVGANHELVNGIGVAPDYHIPVTADALSKGHDEDINKAITLLH